MANEYSTIDDLDADDGVEVNQLEVAGAGAEVIEDEFKNRWTIPNDSLTEDSAFLPTEWDLINDQLDPRFHYQLVKVDKVAEYSLSGFVPVKKAEFKGINPELLMEYGKPVTDIYARGDVVLMKIPRVLAMRRLRQKENLKQQMLNLTEPTPEMLARAGRGGQSLTPALERLREAARATKAGSFSDEISSRQSPKLTE